MNILFIDYLMGSKVGSSIGAGSAGGLVAAEIESRNSNFSDKTGFFFHDQGAGFRAVESASFQ